MAGAISLHHAALTQAVTKALAEAHRGHQSTLAATNQHFLTKIEALEKRVDELDQFNAALSAANQQLRLALASAKLERDIRRPPSPIVEWLAHHGPTPADALFEMFRAGTPEKLVELQTAREVTTAEIDLDGVTTIVYRWIPPQERRHAAQIDLWETIRPQDWCFPITAIEEPLEAT
ncbi:MAG: hypothetical protein GY929_18085 [Actinomycetia bacterium]|nr:hypothetical protein [Actinomycetes bacterium]